MFQAQVITGNDIELDGLLYPTQHVNTMQFIQSNLSQIPSTIIGAAQNLFQEAAQKYKQLQSSATMMRVMNALKLAKNTKQENIIYEINNIEDSQLATVTMQRWLMACPEVRTLYHEQRCNGYSDTYVDVEPEKVGEDHYDWRQVMTGVVRYDSDDIVSKFYMEELKPGDRELNPYEKIAIVNSWEVMKIAVSQMLEDPTDPMKGTLS
mgnify:CR=1 FL=1